MRWPDTSSTTSRRIRWARTRTASRCICATSGRRQAGGRRRRSRARSTRRCSTRSTRRSPTATQNWQQLKFPERRYLRLGAELDLHPQGSVLRWHAGDARSGRGHQRRARARGAGRRVTTDHISPAGSIKLNGPAGKYLTEHGVKPADFNSYGWRRGNHEVMVRGTFANVRLRNKLAPGTEGGVTRLLPEGRHDVDLRRVASSMRKRGTPLCDSCGQGVRLRLARATGRRRGHACWAFASSSPRATSASIARTWSAWAFFRCSSWRGRMSNRWC